MMIFRTAAIFFLALITGAHSWCGTKTPDSEDNSTLAKNYRIVTVVQPPFIFKNSTCMDIVNGTGREKDCYSGFCIDLMKKIEQELAFNWTIYDVSDYGDLSKDPNTKGKWNGMVQEILENRADIALGALENTTERKSVIDFTEVFRKTTEGKSYAMGVKKGSDKLLKSLSHMVFKLINQRHIEQLVEVWWVENRTKDGKFVSPK